MNFEFWKSVVEFLANATVFLGFPIAILQYKRAIQKEQRDREYGTYDALDNKYLEFLYLCLQHPELDIFDVPDEKIHQFTDVSPSNNSSPNFETQKKELIAFSILISILERAYLLYADQSTEIKQRQWEGWRQYMEDYAKRENFQRAWQICGEQFDQEFVRFMDEIIKKHLPSTSTS
ncbi:hypothetical protein ARMA_0533 [Ardenticatena maritima]|uniref:Uncharacterized protein n=1 Tax=Ardenticatena maritima TaxID=872965 RepID=A0A0M9UBQ8_9CHLR|nr:hypothetical protein [Ardenticatena maritima]KPL89453.1 hypothetical protein SE16_03160 [Ardenticatena maritima]GAP62110.1 hypothetical protein ARMA_0533 [Ardenticatena maritima]